MPTTLRRDLSEAPASGDPPRGEFDEERSIREALRITLLFVAVVILLLWAGVADAASGQPGTPTHQLPTLGQSAPLCPCGRS
ncbi:MAG: hypothetical protein ACREVS_04570 [Burkholderiales bacterium]